MLKEHQQLKPLLSLSMIFLTLLGILFCKMEVRRMGYEVWKLVREEKKIREEHRRLKVQLAQVLGPHRIRQRAESELELRRANKDQIVHLSFDSLAEATHE